MTDSLTALPPGSYLEDRQVPPFSMIRVPGGPFWMGSQEEEAGSHSDERPRHQVRVPDFFLGQYPVTQALWQAVMGENPSYFPGAKRPVERVSWEDCQRFIAKLNELTGQTYRLPSEAEWEYAARGGPCSEGYRYAGSDFVDEVGWYCENSGSETHPVGQKLPNELGFYDLSGNIREWCEDDWHDRYEGAPDDGSAWIDQPQLAARRVARGGAWIRDARGCRVAYRDRYSPGYRNYGLGLRLAR